MSDKRDPRAANDREYRKFKTTGDRQKVAVYVVGEDGESIGSSTDRLLTALLIEQRAIRIGLSIQTGQDLYAAALEEGAD